MSNSVSTSCHICLLINCCIGARTLNGGAMFFEKLVGEKTGQACGFSGSILVERRREEMIYEKRCQYMSCDCLKYLFRPWIYMPRGLTSRRE